MKKASVIIGFIMILAGCAIHTACLMYVWNCLAVAMKFPLIGLRESVLLQALTWVALPIQQSDYLEDPDSFVRISGRRMFVTLSATAIAWIAAHV